MQATGAKVLAHARAAARIGGVDRGLAAGDVIRVGRSVELESLDTPGHTLSHVCLLAHAKGRRCFPATRCSTPASATAGAVAIRNACTKPARSSSHGSRHSTRIYPGHDYLLNNLRFTRHVEAGNQAAADWLRRSENVRPEDQPVLTLGQELSFNSFFRLTEPGLIETLRERVPALPRPAQPARSVSRPARTAKQLVMDPTAAAPGTRGGVEFAPDHSQGVMDVSPILNPLNDAQRAAVTAPLAPTLVLAGAGSGKTRVLIHRIAWLIQAEGATPHGILAVTFTNKAAAEMRARVEALLGGSGSALWLGTFHGLAHRLLRLHWREAGLLQSFQILDSEDQLRLIKKVVKALELDEARFVPREVQYFINKHKDEGRRPQHLKEGGDPTERTLIRTYAEYEQVCARMGAVDFAELLLRAFELWRDHPELLVTTVPLPSRAGR